MREWTARMEREREIERETENGKVVDRRKRRRTNTNGRSKRHIEGDFKLMTNAPVSQIVFLDVI